MKSKIINILDVICTITMIYALFHFSKETCLWGTIFMILTEYFGIRLACGIVKIYKEPFENDSTGEQICKAILYGYGTIGSVICILALPLWLGFNLFAYIMNWTMIR